MQFAAGVACHLYQMSFDKSMDIFLRPFVKVVRIVLSVLQNGVQSLLDSGRLFVGQYSRAQQAVAMSYAGTDIHRKEPAIKTETPIEFRKPGIGLAGESPTPQILFCFSSHCK